MMRYKIPGVLLVLFLLFLFLATAMPASPSRLALASENKRQPSELISQESLLGYLEELTSIQAYSGWRNSASAGEREALDYVGATLGKMDYLNELGMTLERQEFNVLLATDIWESRLVVTVDGQSIEVPADALRGSRDNVERARRFDSDGNLTDSENDPVNVSGEVLLIDSVDDIRPNLDAEGKIMVVDYALVDRSILNFQTALQNAWLLVDTNPAAVVLVTQFSNTAGASHGAFVGGGNVFNWVESEYQPPILYARVEDMAAAGIQSLDDLTKLETAEITWDADVLSPGQSGNLVAHIPGHDSSQAVILGAHIDSPNSPGALDNGSGSVVLMEVARVLNESQTQPPIDVVLAWYGSEEIGLYGSYYFVATHQELLDRAMGVLNVDCLSHPLDGVEASLMLNTWSFGRHGDGRILWPEYLQEQAAALDIETVPHDEYSIESDNSPFAGYGVPHANLIYMNGPRMSSLGGVHYAGQLHSPYDTIELASAQVEVLAEMAQVALAAALNTGEDMPVLRVTPPAEHRAVIVGSHTEAVQLGPSLFTDMGMAFEMAGFDVDLIPYGQPVTANDLADADIVIVLPMIDYPSVEGGDVEVYDVGWSAEGVDVLDEYVASGGLLVLTNSGNILDFFNRPIDFNEDWPDANVLGERFGVEYVPDLVPNQGSSIQIESPLLEGMRGLTLAERNGISFELARGDVLVTAGSTNVIGQLDYGEGEVIVLADVGIFQLPSASLENLQFINNLARFAIER